MGPGVRGAPRPHAGLGDGLPRKHAQATCLLEAADILKRAAPVELVFYSAPECHLCEVGLARIAELAAELGLSVRVVDISNDPQLESRYRSRIPVAEIRGRTAFKYEVDEARVRRLVTEARSDPEGRFGP